MRPADPADVAEWLAATQPAEGHALGRRAPPRARRAGDVRCGRVRSPHLSLWPVGLREDLFARARARAPPRRDGPPSHHSRSQLRLRPARRLRAEADSQLAAGYAEAANGVVVRRAGSGLHLAIGQLEPRARAAALELDPVADREEFALVDEMLEAGAAIEELATSETPHARALRLRARTSALSRWELWARGRPGSLVDDVERRDARCLVVDLGSLATRAGASCRRGGRSRNALASARRSRARSRRDRRGAQRLSAEPGGSRHGARDRACCPDCRRGAQVRPLLARLDAAAAEGPRERPQPVRQPHGDADELTRRPRLRRRRLLLRSPEPRSSARQRFARAKPSSRGKIVSHPCFVRFGARVAEEGGSDIPADWARIEARAPAGG